MNSQIILFNKKHRPKIKFNNSKETIAPKKSVKKKSLKINKIFILLLCCFVLTGCGLGSSKTTKYKLEGYGRFRVPNNAVFRKDHSSSRKLFFVKEIDRTNSLPNNISVEGGTNRYSEKDHEQFRKAIMSQLVMQSNSYKATVNGSGTNTKRGYKVYIFDLDYSSGHTRQYYIIGDYKYILVHETVMNGKEDKDLDKIAEHIVNTFKWK